LRRGRRAAAGAFIDCQGAEERGHHLYPDDQLSTQLEALRIRLDRQARQLERIERDVQVLLESFALYVRYQLTIIAPRMAAGKRAMDRLSNMARAHAISERSRDDLLPSC
jgi:hypothetical protein